MGPFRVMRVIARTSVGGPALQLSTLMRGVDPKSFEQRLSVGCGEPEDGDFRQLGAPDIAVSVVPYLSRSVRFTEDLRARKALSRAIRASGRMWCTPTPPRPAPFGCLVAVLRGMPTGLVPIRPPPEHRSRWHPV
jgi:hypothetical protein